MKVCVLTGQTMSTHKFSARMFQILESFVTQCILGHQEERSLNQGVVRPDRVRRQVVCALGGNESSGQDESCQLSSKGKRSKVTKPVCGCRQPIAVPGKLAC